MLRNGWPASSGIGGRNQSEWVAGFARNRRPEPSGICSQLIKAEKTFYIGNSFTVERSTGKIIGGALDNKGDYQMKVIDDGSFKVFSYAEKRGVAESLVIKTWVESENKPFVGIDYLQHVLTGTCD